MQLVEVVCPDGVDEGVVKSAFQFVEKTKKVPIQCSDERGFIVNRLLIPYIMQARVLFLYVACLMCVDNS